MKNYKALVLLFASAAFALLASVEFLRPAASEPIAREEMLETFSADTANLVYRWNPEDPRSEEERRLALFEFMYETYDNSTWLPQSLFERNRVTQVVTGDTDNIVSNRIGMALWPENRAVKAYGMAPQTEPGKPLGWTVNCLVCHSAEIDGVVYLGAGSKVFDEKAITDALRILTSRTGRFGLSRSSFDYEMAVSANEIMRRQHLGVIAPPTRARSTAFAASHVELGLRSHNGAVPSEQEVGSRDIAKIPPLWHTAAKLPFGRWYVDGSFRGQYALMSTTMELKKGRSFDEIERHVLPRIKKQFDEVVQHLRPPRYPHSIDRALAAEGKRLFYSSQMGCHTCHGTYDEDGNVEWTGVHVDVGTDRVRLEVVTKGFTDAFRESPLADHGSLQKSEGYAAPPLTGVWANFPYLHNGSVPTLHHLLGAEAERPKIFSVVAARHFDRERVGQKLSPEKFIPLGEAELLRKFRDDRNWFNTDRTGHGNQGHEVWSRIKTDENRRALIEYLKTL